VDKVDELRGGAREEEGDVQDAEDEGEARGEVHRRNKTNQNHT
jgi:hypothetical protein